MATRADLEVVKGIVIFAPTMPDLMETLGIINAGNDLDIGGRIRFTTQPQTALTHAADFFAAWS